MARGLLADGSVTEVEAVLLRDWVGRHQDALEHWAVRTIHDRLMHHFILRSALLSYDDWFIREVEKGLAQVDAGQVLTHDAVRSRLDQKVAERQSRR